MRKRKTIEQGDVWRVKGRQCLYVNVFVLFCFVVFWKRVR